MKTKEVVLAYKSKPNKDNKTTYIEFVGLAPKWQDREVFIATCKLTDYTPFFIHVSKKEWRRLKNDKPAILKKYTDAMDDLFNKVKNGQINP